MTDKGKRKRAAVCAARKEGECRVLVWNIYSTQMTEANQQQSQNVFLCSTCPVPQCCSMLKWNQQRTNNGLSGNLAIKYKERQAFSDHATVEYP